MSMNLQLALIPSKHVRIEQSILALAGQCISLLDTPKSPDELYSRLNAEKTDWKFKPTMDYIILALDTLYAIKMLKCTTDNRIQVVNNASNKTIVKSTIVS